MSIKLTVISVIVVAMAMVGDSARADDVNAAARAFSQAQEAVLAGDNARAADLYELADDLAPSAPALRNAARARLAAGHDAMAATLAAELLRRYPSDKESRDVAEAILSKLSPRLAQFDISCDEECTVTLDGKAASSKSRTRHVFFAQPGARAVGVTFDGGRQASKQVTTVAGQTTTLTLEAPPRPVKSDAQNAAANGVTATTGRAPTAAAHGISRKWIIGTAILTAGFGVAAGLQGMATLDTRDQIKAAVAANDSALAMSLYNDGRDEQLRTNLFIAGAAAAGVATIALAFATDWSGSPERHEVAVTPTVGGAALVYGGHF
jgi:hypothetical protein